jgi:hypothetical protein
LALALMADGPLVASSIGSDHFDEAGQVDANNNQTETCYA